MPPARMREVHSYRKQEEGVVYGKKRGRKPVPSNASRQGTDGAFRPQADRRKRNPREFPNAKNYRDNLHKAADYFKAQGIRRVDEIDAEKIQQYEEYLEVRGLSPSTIHSYLAPVCKRAGVPMDAIEKPKRHASEYTRSDGSGRHSGGGRPAELNRYLGLRRGDLEQLHGDDLISRGGHAYVVVARSKGGKRQEQRVPDEYAAGVRKFFDTTPNKLFSKADFNANFDYHAQRRALAQEVCAAYAEKLKVDPSYRKVLYKELTDYWHRNNRKNRGKLEPLSYFDKPYKLRGKNREKALKMGYPTEYDRLALRATSVFHLAHWRDDVSVASYVTAR